MLKETPSRQLCYLLPSATKRHNLSSITPHPHPLAPPSRTSQEGAVYSLILRIVIDLSEPSNYPRAISQPILQSSNRSFINGNFLSDSFSPDRLDTVSRPYTKEDTTTTSFADFWGQDDDDVRSMDCSTSLLWDIPFGNQGTVMFRP